MLPVRLCLILTLLLAIAGCGADPCVQPQGESTFSPFTESQGYLRTTIETYPEQEKRCWIEYLDRAQAIADRGKQLLRDGDIEGLYAELAGLYKQQAAEEGFRESIHQLEAAYGQITRIEYRNQALEYPAGETAQVDLARAQSKTWYAVTTTGSMDPGLFLVVTVIREGSRFGILSITYASYGENVPLWLRSANASTSPLEETTPPALPPTRLPASSKSPTTTPLAGRSIGPGPTIADADAAEEAIRLFHERFNAGQYQAIYDNAHILFQSSQSKADLLAAMRKTREEFGRFVDVTDNRVNVLTGPPVEIRAVYVSRFEKTDVTEQFIFLRDGDEVKLALYAPFRGAVDLDSIQAATPGAGP